jgi:predicted RNA-binding Zn-ribbon protein involved in translation (DUF1610 family)
LDKPKILLFDLETSHNIMAVFSLYDTKYGIPHDNILKERMILSAAWKWLGQREVGSISVMDSPTFWEGMNLSEDEDLVILEKLAELWKDADAVVAHFGDKFDIKYINTRLAYYRLPPFPPVIQIDTYKIAKSKFLFNSNRLDYLGKFLGVGRKVRTDKGLWLQCLEGMSSAITKLVTYNQGDVRLLERVYKVLVPFAPAKINFALFAEKEVCPSCGSAKTVKHKHRVTRTRKYIQYQCGSCGHYFVGTKSITKATVK